MLVGGITSYDVVSNWRRTGKLGGSEDAGGYCVFALPLLMLLSWSLRAIKDEAAGPRTRRVALIAAPVLAIAIVFCVVAMFRAPFNP